MRDRLHLHARSDGVIWTDEHVARGLLEAHLDPSSDAASRNPVTIERTVAWIGALRPKRGRLLDLGCGPGLYAERFHDAGFAVTGIDISTLSLEHARQSAGRTGRDITYRHGNYLVDALGSGYDVAVCIYCDVGALLPSERAVLLDRVRAALRPGGAFVFDVHGRGLCRSLIEERRWTYEASSSFWSPRPHFVLEERVHFPEAQAWGSRTIVLDEGGPAREFITWDHYFDDDQVTASLAEHGFEVDAIERALVLANDFASDDVLFVAARTP